MASAIWIAWCAWLSIAASVAADPQASAAPEQHAPTPAIRRCRAVVGLGAIWLRSVTGSPCSAGLPRATWAKISRFVQVRNTGAADENSCDGSTGPDITRRLP